MSTIQLGPEDTSIVMGTRGTGKTTLCQQLVEAKRPRVAVWDPVAQYPEDVAYRPRRIDDVDEFEAFVARMWARPPVCLVVEESEQVLPQIGKLPPNFNQFASVGRNYGHTFILNTRQPQAVEKRAYNLCDHFFIFRLEGTGIDQMRRRVGAHNREKFDEMLSWKKDDHQFFWYHGGVLDGPEKLDLKPRPAAAKSRKRSKAGGK